MLSDRSWASSMMIVSYLRSIAVALHLVEQDAVGHHLDERVVARLVGEPHLVADRGAQLDLELLGDPLGHRARGDAPRLRVADQALAAAADLEADLGQLGGLARARLPRDDHDLVVTNGSGDVVLVLDDRQVLGVVQVRHRHVTPRRALGPAPRTASAPSGTARPLSAGSSLAAAVPVPAGTRGLGDARGGHAAQHTCGPAAVTPVTRLPYGYCCTRTHGAVASVGRAL